MAKQKEKENSVIVNTLRVISDVEKCSNTLIESAKYFETLQERIEEVKKYN